MLDRFYTEKLISEADDHDLMNYVKRLNQTKTEYCIKDERWGDAISKNEIAGIINRELCSRKIENLLCLPN